MARRGDLPDNVPHCPGPVEAIWTKCLECRNGNIAQIRNCSEVACSLWRFRVGSPLFPGSTEPIGARILIEAGMIVLSEVMRLRKAS